MFAWGIFLLKVSSGQDNIEVDGLFDRPSAKKIHASSVGDCGER